MTNHIESGQSLTTCDGCGKTVPFRVANGNPGWWGVEVRPQITSTILSAKDNPSAYGPPVDRHACSGECLALVYEKFGGHLPKDVEAIAKIEEQVASHG